MAVGWPGFPASGARWGLHLGTTPDPMAASALPWPPPFDCLVFLPPFFLLLNSLYNPLSSSLPSDLSDLFWFFLFSASFQPFLLCGFSLPGLLVLPPEHVLWRLSVTPCLSLRFPISARLSLGLSHPCRSSCSLDMHPPLLLFFGLSVPFCSVLP